MARPRFLMPGAGERLLAAKLRLLSGTSERRTSAALGILTGARSEPLVEIDLDIDQTRAVPTQPAPTAVEPAPRARRARYAARTVYLTDANLRDIERISAAWQKQAGDARRWNRSAVLRRAVEHLRTVVEADPENESPEVSEHV